MSSNPPRLFSPRFSPLFPKPATYLLPFRAQMSQTVQFVAMSNQQISSPFFVSPRLRVTRTIRSVNAYANTANSLSNPFLRLRVSPIRSQQERLKRWFSKFEVSWWSSIFFFLSFLFWWERRVDSFAVGNVNSLNAFKVKRIYRGCWYIRQTFSESIKMRLVCK